MNLCCSCFSQCFMFISTMVSSQTACLPASPPDPFVYVSLSFCGMVHTHAYVYVPIFLNVNAIAQLCMMNLHRKQGTFLGMCFPLNVHCF